MDYTRMETNTQMATKNRGVMCLPLSGNKRFLSELCSSQLVKAAEDEENKK